MLRILVVAARAAAAAIFIFLPIAACAAPEPKEPAATAGILLPGAISLDEGLRKRLAEALAAKGKTYEPRTRHLAEDGSPLYTNRLILETSPYLLQHAHNPVNWYPWGDEAFETAKRLGRPVLLSVGYSTCHWCHVMEEESFEDVEIARVLNEHYVAIKVDREERPDVDGIYMKAVQMMTGHGGWPMTVFLTADRVPFFGGTYFPPRDGDRGARVGFLTILESLHVQYAKDGARVAAFAEEMRARLLETVPTGSGDVVPGVAPLDAAFAIYRRAYDPEYGGLGGAPKFPSSLPVRLILRHALRTGDTEALRMATNTLDRMADGGMYDQVGGGFHRYSVDRRWLVPHFEKMLYDNALLAVAYLEAWQATGEGRNAEVVRDILRYVAREMTSPEGAFYSATDADSPNPEGEREEGWFFTWTPAELEEVLGKERAKVVALRFGVTAEGNFEGRSILHVAKPIEAVAKETGLENGAVTRILEEAREALYAARAKRPPPLRDDKILAAWNGLMISAFARAGFALHEDDWVSRAERAASFVLDKMRVEGRLRRTSKDGRARHVGVLDDYAFLTAGLLDLHEATSDPRWLTEAIALQKVLDARFRDPAGGYFLTPDDHEALLLREKPDYDGAEPSGNAVALLNLLRLHEWTTDDAYRVSADALLKAFSESLSRNPSALSEMLLALDFRHAKPKEVVLVAPRSREELEPFLSRLRKGFRPHRVLVTATEGADLAAKSKLVPFLEGKRAIGGKPTAFVCEAGVCRLPTSDPEIFVTLLSEEPSDGHEKRGP